ncbi:ATG-C domain containing protein [Pyrenophora tritici-repentis]|uniref:ATG-C domain containing protein n=1 Tax=Pyrenophora tritici-repentis TaxID=45151 RepID=A0A922SWU3_9PLEO|nr:ATG-C domain containing protein [Pyrenophora tritici-repentis]
MVTSEEVPARDGGVVDNGGRGGEGNHAFVLQAIPEEPPTQYEAVSERNIQDIPSSVHTGNHIQTHAEPHTTTTPPTPTESHSDLYTSDVPSYTQTASNGERSVDVQVVRPSKATSSQDGSPSYQACSSQLPQEHTARSEAGPARNSQSSQPQQSEVVSVHEASSPTRADIPRLDRPIHTRSLSDPTASTHAILDCVRVCSVLQDRPAVWLVKRKNMALSALAGAVLTKEGLLKAKDMQLITIATGPGTNREPTDPLSGVLVGCYDVADGIISGLIAGPVTLGKQISHRHSTVNPDASSTGSRAKGVARASGRVALGTAKGLGKVVTTSLKSPLLIMEGVTRGFHNFPKTYGEEVRQYETVTGLRSGLVVSAKSFGHGIGDGIKDIVAKQIDGAEKNGVIGFGTGLATGVANVVCKPTAGVSGLVSYSSLGLYRSIRKIGASKKEDPAEEVRSLGEAECRELGDADRLFIVRRWCQTQMHVNID